MSEVIAETQSETRAHEMALVLSALGISHLVEPTESGWRLLVAPDRADEARVALFESAKESESPLAIPEYGSTNFATISVFLLAAFHMFVRLLPVVGRAPSNHANRNESFFRGGADAKLIVQGEWWRNITALTLHADLAHLLGNLALGWFVWNALGRWIGPAATAWLVLATGAIGNELTGIILGIRSDHVAIGASTSVFGSLGLLGGLQLTRHERGRAFLVFATSLALLGMLGISERADVWAHLFGLVVGLFLGGLAGPLGRRPPRRSWKQWVGAWFAGILVLGCWLLAFP